MPKKWIIILVAVFLTVFGAVYFLLSNIETEIPEVVEEPAMIGLYYQDRFTKDVYYNYEDDEYYSITGIDVSEHNQDIDFKKVRESGIDFVYLRVGWRGYSEGLLHEDAYFRKYYRDAKENGLLVGVYFFSQAISTEEAIEEARFVRSVISGLDIDLDIAYDFEYINEYGARTDGILKEQCTADALAFFKELEGEHRVILYANATLVNRYYDMDSLSAYRLWYAQYNELPEYAGSFSIWQYSDKGDVPGCSKPVDLNIMFIKKR